MSEEKSVAAKLIDFISAEDDDRFYPCLEEVKDAEELNVILPFYSPLGLACAFDRWEFVHAMLRKGADVNFRIGRLQQYPIHCAAMNENRGVKCTELLYQHGADLNAQDGEKNTALHLAIMIDNVLLFNFLMENGANTNLINTQQQTPLIRATISQNKYMIKRLVAAGCDVNYPNGDPLEHLIRYPGLIDCLELLITNGADIKRQPYHITAARYNNIDMLKLLKDRGADIKAHSGILDFTALHHACESPRASHKMVELLVEWGIDINAESITFDTPLHVACQQCNLKKVLSLFEFNPDVNKRNASLATPLSMLLTASRYFDELGDVVSFRLFDFFKIFKLLTAAGTRVTNCDIDIFQTSVPITLRDTQSEQEIFEFLEAIKDYAYEPVKLRDLCRAKVRNCLPPKVSDKIKELPLPESLKSFLMFQDVLS